MNVWLNAHLKNTLHGILGCNCKGNCILKSIYVDEVQNGSAYLTIEPFDDAFNQNQVEETIEKIKRVMWKRRKSIYKKLGANYLSVTIYDEWTMKDSFVLSKKNDEIHSSVN